jgi:hypothetical protein
LSSGSCFGSQATKRLAQTRFNKHGAVATGRARCAIRRRGALWHSGPKNTPLFAPTRGRLFAAGVQTFRFLNLARYFCVSVLRRCISKKAQEPYGRILTFFVTSTLDRGWSMTLSSALSLVLFALALIGVTRADNQQAQQSSVNAAICLLAVRSRSLPDRRSDLQARYTELACCQRLYLIGSNAVDSTIY